MRSLVVLLAVALAAPAHAAPGDRWDPGTMGLQFVAGAGGGLAGGAVLGLAGLGVGFGLQNGKNDWATPLICTAVGAGIGGILGTILAVDYMGDRRNSTGHWWGATLGLTAGAFALGGLQMALDHTHLHPPPVTMMVIGALLLFGGTVVGYQLSANEHPPVMPLASLAF